MNAVLHVIPDVHFGGAALSAMELVRELMRRGNYDVRLCVLGTAEGQAVPEDLASRTNFLDMENPTSSPIALARAVRRLRRIFQRQKITIAHSHLLSADLVTALASAAHPSILHIAHVRDTRPWLYSDRAQDRIKAFLHRAAYKLARTQFVAVSTSSAKFAQRAFEVPEHRMRVVLNGVALERLDRPTSVTAQSPTFNIGCAGRLVPEKGFLTAVEATAILSRVGHDIALTIVGTGSQELALRQLATDLNARVRICAKSDDMAAFYQSIDLMLVPSLATEGLPRVVLEAMASGVPVIAATSAGAGDVISHGETGLLVPPADPSALADAIVTFIEDEPKRKRIVTEGRRLVRETFTVQRVTKEIECLYDTSLA